MRAASYGAAGAALAGYASGCPSRRPGPARPVRRDIQSLAPDDPVILAYKSAITQMKALPASDKRSWQNQALIHQNFCPHGNWLFLPWHRIYLLYFERICRKLSGMKDFALPYWNWSANPQVPAAFWGDASDPLFFTPRVAIQTSIASATDVGPLVIGSILDEPNFLQFASYAISATVAQQEASPDGYGSLEETPHNYIHGFVGGTMGTFMSPLDPIFWLHHNMIERCWVDWNLIRNHPNTNDPAWTERTFTEFVDEDGNPVEVSVATSLLFPLSYYQYDTWSTADGREELAGRERQLRSGREEDRAAMERLARTGAPVDVDIVSRFPLQQRITASLGQTTTIALPVQREALRLDPGRAEERRSMLVFKGVSLNHTEDFYVHVFVNKPDATATTPTSDPHFVGSFAFFGHAPGGEQTPTGSYNIDATRTLQRLNLEGGTVDVNLVLVPFPGREPQTRSLSLASTELRIIRDVGIQPRQ
jgi:tyrosinase